MAQAAGSLNQCTIIGWLVSLHTKFRRLLLFTGLFCLNYMYHIQVDFDICCTFNFFGLISVCLAFSLHFCIDVLLFSYGVERDLDFHLAGWQL